MSGKKDKESTKERVRVICRVRPQNNKETQNGGRVCLSHGEENVEVLLEDGKQTFTFDRVLGAGCSQSDVFDATVKPLVSEVLNGYNATVFAYGQTASGKTFTMEGPDIYDPQYRGIIPRTVEALFEGVSNAAANMEFTIRVSYVEIYCEKIRDLLDRERLKTNLMIREDKIRGVYIAGVTEEYVTSVEELLGIMNAGATNRAVAATGMNEGSSRSHSVFTIVINQRDVVTSASKSAKLVLVDLAGSEMVRKTNASGQQLEEAKMINKSLSSLGLVIMALTDDKAQHVPYRDSKLTRILQDSLGGNSHTVLIVNCSPSSYNAPETVSTLRFGTRAKNIENKVQVNRVRSVEELENLLAKAERTIETQEAHILALNVQLRQALDASGAVAAATAAAATEGSAAAVDASASPVQLTAPSIASGDLESIAQLNATITKLQEELEEEREESLRLGNESAVMSELLREREQQISDATSMMKEAQKQFEAHRDRADQVVRELSRAQSEIDSLRAQINDDNSRHKFEVEELELSLKRHREENEKLLQAAANVVSSVADDMSAGSIPATIETAASAKLARPTASGAAMFNRTRVQNELSAIFRQKSVSPLSRDAEALVLDLVERYAMPMSPSAAGANSGNGGERWAHTRLLEKENQRKLTELSQQRLRLVEDLSLVTEKANIYRKELDFLRSPDGGAVVAKFIGERELETSNKMRQRLEQLVTVHRQLLKKFRVLEVEHTEMVQKLSLRNDRIRQLEAYTRSLTTKLRAQMDQHLAELSSMYEYVQSIKASQPVIQSKTASAAASSGANRLPTGPRTVRGGQANVMEGAVAPPQPPNAAAESQTQEAAPQNGSSSGGFSAVKALGLTSGSFGGSSKSLTTTAASGSQQVDLSAVDQVPRPESSPRKSSGAKLLAMFMPSKKSS